MSLIAEVLGRAPVVAEFLDAVARAGRSSPRRLASLPLNRACAARQRHQNLLVARRGHADRCGQPRVGGVDAESLAGTAAVNSRPYHVRQYYYDTAASANPIAVQGLKTLLGGTSHVVFGTDIPYGTSA